MVEVPKNTTYQLNKSEGIGHNELYSVDSVWMAWSFEYITVVGSYQVFDKVAGRSCNEL